MGYQQNPLAARHRIAGALFVAAGIAVSLKFMGPAAMLFSLGLLAAYFIWAAAIWLIEPEEIVPLYLIAIAIQALHSGEEYLAGFPRKFPAFFGYEWSNRQFVVFNLVCFALFLLAALGLWLKFRLAWLVVFSFAIVGEIGNGVGHLALSIAQRKYFPGAISAPVVLVVGVVLLTKLLKTAEHLPGQSNEIQTEQS
jgi:hypothetical protein